MRSPLFFLAVLFVTAPAALPAAEPLISALRDGGVQSTISKLGGYDVSRTGSVEILA